MHELIDGARRILDVPGVIFAGLAAVFTVSHVEAFMTIFAAAVSAACGLVRLYDWWFKNRPISGE